MKNLVNLFIGAKIECLYRDGYGASRNPLEGEIGYTKSSWDHESNVSINR